MKILLIGKEETLNLTRKEFKKILDEENIKFEYIFKYDESKYLISFNYQIDYDFTKFKEMIKNYKPLFIQQVLLISETFMPNDYVGISDYFKEYEFNIEKEDVLSIKYFGDYDNEATPKIEFIKSFEEIILNKYPNVTFDNKNAEKTLYIFNNKEEIIVGFDSN